MTLSTLPKEDSFWSALFTDAGLPRSAWGECWLVIRDAVAELGTMTREQMLALTGRFAESESGVLR